MKQVSEPEMLHRMAAYCSTAERCIQDIQKKIEQEGLSVESTHRIISRLVKEKFINENRFARSFVNDKFRFNKWGRIKINHELGRKNIPPDIRQEALDSIDEQEYLSVLMLLLKEKEKVTKAKNDQELFYKLLRFANGRGFESKETISCLRKILKDNDYTDTFE